MVEVWLPYGKTEVHISVPLRYLLGTVEPDKGQPSANPFETITESLRNPIESKTIGELVRPRSKVAVAIDGTLTPSLAANAASSVVWTLNQSGVPSENITIVVGNGRREYGSQELMSYLQGSNILKDVDVVEHNRNSANVTPVGTTSAGTNVEVCGSFMSADFRIAIGEVLVDHFSGLRGAHSTVLPALSGKAAIEHSLGLSFRGEVTPGVPGESPVYADQVEASQLAGVDLAVQLVTNGYGELVSVFSGGIESTWGSAVAALGESFKVKAESNADIIVLSAGGSRFDFDLYNSVWALRGISSIAKRGATIILLAECADGLGAEGLETLAQVDTLSELRRRYMLGARAVHVIKNTLRSNEVVLVSALPGYLAEPLGLSVERTASDALEKVMQRRRGRRTLVVTHGCSTVPEIGSEREEVDQGQGDHADVDEHQQLS
jgi:nickel-dependent lactate racemase